MNNCNKNNKFAKYISFVNGVPYIFYNVEYNVGSSTYFFETKSQPLEEYFRKNHLDTLSVY
jgi:glutaredoxin